jgi:hypothetical protein
MRQQSCWLMILKHLRMIRLFKGLSSDSCGKQSSFQAMLKGKAGSLYSWWEHHKGDAPLCPYSLKSSHHTSFDFNVTPFQMPHLPSVPVQCTVQEGKENLG